MIMESFSDLSFWVVGLIFQGFHLINLPVELIDACVSIMRFGIWVLGIDLFIIVWTCIIFWLTFRLSAGIILFIYRLIPFV